MTTIEEHEAERWGEPPAGATFLIRRCHELRTKPIGEFSVEDLRIMIGQGIGLRWLVSAALDVLEEAPLAASDMHEGDLLENVLSVPELYWAGDTGSWLRLRDVAEKLVALTPIIERAQRFLEHSRGGA
jgi:hypothetical protein